MTGPYVVFSIERKRWEVRRDAGPYSVLVSHHDSEESARAALGAIHG